VQKGAISLLFHDYIGSSCGCVYQAIVKDEVRVIQGESQHSPSSEGLMALDVIAG
jgi:hypothetical protein